MMVGDSVLFEYDMERVMEQLEMRCYDGLQDAMKTTEGIGIEYDEDVVCDICRSVHAVLIFTYCVTFASQRVSLIVIPFCLSVCRSFRDLQPTMIDRSQPNLVGRYILVLGPV